MRRNLTTAGRVGFSLVELLVVVGILALLMGILLPSLRKAREHARRVVCVDNLRQIAIAFVAYTENNLDKFPRPGADPRFEDWIYWQPGRDLNQSRIVPYLGERFDARTFRCPTDDPAAHAYQSPVYGFSYSVNANICAVGGTDPTTRRPRDSINRNQIRDPTRCALIVEESQQTINDGCWAWQGALIVGVAGLAGGVPNVSSIRHDRSDLTREDLTHPEALAAGRSNVGFCDGHAEPMPRAQMFDAAFWNPRYATFVGGFQ